MTSFPYSTSKLAKTFIPINQFVEKYFCYCRRPQKFKVGKTICKDEEMLQCVDCSELYHRICLPVTCSSNFKKKNSNWACPTYSIAWFTFYLPMKFLFSNTELYFKFVGNLTSIFNKNLLWNKNYFTLHYSSSSCKWRCLLRRCRPSDFWTTGKKLNT